MTPQCMHPFESCSTTLGLNWYLNPNVKLMWDYVRSDVDASDTDDAADIFMMRV